MTGEPDDDAEPGVRSADRARAEETLRRLLGGRDFRTAVGDYEGRLIARALERSGGHQARAAEALGVGPTTLNSKIMRLTRRGLFDPDGAGTDAAARPAAHRCVEIVATGIPVDVEAADDGQVVVVVHQGTPAQPGPEIRFVATASGPRIVLGSSWSSGGTTVRVRLPHGMRLRTTTPPADPAD